MPKFVVYSVWTKAEIIEAKTQRHAYDLGAPLPRNDDLNLCNWHVMLIPEEKDDDDQS